jgi:hypothetical protein
VIRALIAIIIAFGMCGPANADPFFTPIFISLFSAAGITGTVATAAATILGAIVTTAIGLGLALLFSPKPPRPENGSIAVQQPIPYRIFGYGTARIAGAVVLKEEAAGNLAVVQVLNGHLVSAFQGLYLNDDLVNLVSNSGASTGNLVGSIEQGADQRYWNVKVGISTRRGLTPETYYNYIAGLVPSIWGVDYRGDGCASLALNCLPVQQKDFQKTYPYGAPLPSVIEDQYIVFDPRDGTQSVSNPATWKFSRNSALCILHFECFSIYGPRRNYSTAILPVLAQWIQAANDCDDAMALKAGGTEPRYHLGGWITTEQDRKTARQTMLQTCDGWFVERGDGTIILSVGKYYAPTVTLTDDDIIGFFIQRDVASDDKINQATAKYCSPDCSYTTVETKPIVDAMDQAARPGPPRNAQLDLPWVQWTGQSSRLLKREMLRQQEKTRGKITLRLSGINACYERWILVNSNTVPRLNGVVIENRMPTISLATQSCEIEFIASGAYIDTYNPASDESPPSIIPQRPVTVGLPIPATVSVVPTQVDDMSGTISIYLVVSWNTPLYNGNIWYLTDVVQWRIADTGGGIPGPWTQQTFTDQVIASGRNTVATNNVPVGTVIDVQVFSVGTGASLSTGSSIVTVSTVAATTAPGVPTSLTATGGTGSAALSVKSPNSSNFSSVKFNRSTHGSPYNSSVLIAGPIYGSANSTFTYTDTVAPGTYDYWATAVNASGVASAPAGPATATIV